MSVAQGLAHFNDAFLAMAEHWDDFILSYTLKNPSIWHDRIPRGAYELFRGTSPKYNVYRGGLPAQAGLSGWEQIATSRKPNVGTGDAGFDACAPGTPLLYGYSFETFTYSGFKEEYQSLPICLNDLRFVDHAKEQLALVIGTGVEFGVSLQETFNREMYVQQAMQSNRGMVMGTGALAFEDSADYRFSYDPFLVTTDVDGASVPYIVIPGASEMSTLNWDFVDYISYSLSSRCPSAAVAQQSGVPIFGLMTDHADFERMIKADSDSRSDWREAKPQTLIDGYGMGVTVYRRMAIMHDPRQMRFRVKGYNDAGNIVATRVLPLRAGRAGVIGNVPEPNPEYYRAEIGIGVIFMNDVLQNLFVPSLDSLGSGTSFGPKPGLNGIWSWINIPDPQTNMLGEHGFFYGRFEIFPKPMMQATNCTVFAYRRCAHALRTKCKIESHSDATAVGTNVNVVANAVAADVDIVRRRVTLELATLLKGGAGDNVEVLLDQTVAGITDGATATVPMKIADSSTAPKYTFVWDPESTHAGIVELEAILSSGAAFVATAFTAAITKVKVIA